MTPSYVLLTAAKDEADCIAQVLSLVGRQTILPLVWFIVDDGSVDRTRAIVEHFAASHPFVRLCSARSCGQRNFGSQYRAIQGAYQMARSLEFDFVAVQDADQAPRQPDYYEQLLAEMMRDPRLGAASGLITERRKGCWMPRPDNSLDSLAASTLFRRAALEEVGGYTPLNYGGSDWLIQIDLKMAGWQLLVRPDLQLYHFRPTSSAGGLCRGRFRDGMADAAFGSSAVFEFLKCLRRIHTRPLLLGSIIRLLGYFWWRFSRRGPVLPPEKVAFLRREQRRKIHRMLRLPAAIWSRG